MQAPSYLSYDHFTSYLVLADTRSITPTFLAFRLPRYSDVNRLFPREPSVWDPISFTTIVRLTGEPPLLIGRTLTIYSRVKTSASGRCSG